jgi:hypothetical protein
VQPHPQGGGVAGSEGVHRSSLAKLEVELPA